MPACFLKSNIMKHQSNHCWGTGAAYRGATTTAFLPIGMSLPPKKVLVLLLPLPLNNNNNSHNSHNNNSHNSKSQHLLLPSKPCKIICGPSIGRPCAICASIIVVTLSPCCHVSHRRNCVLTCPMEVIVPKIPEKPDTPCVNFANRHGIMI